MKTKTSGLTPRPVRSLIYLPVLRFGLTDQDWMFVLIGGVIGYTIPYVFSLTLWRLPLEIIISGITVLISVGIMNILRLRKKPLYLKYLIQSKLQGTSFRRRRTNEVSSDWLLP